MVFSSELGYDPDEWEECEEEELFVVFGPFTRVLLSAAMVFFTIGFFWLMEHRKSLFKGKEGEEEEEKAVTEMVEVKEIVQEKVMAKAQAAEQQPVEDLVKHRDPDAELDELMLQYTNYAETKAAAPPGQFSPPAKPQPPLSKEELEALADWQRELAAIEAEKLAQVGRQLYGTADVSQLSPTESDLLPADEISFRTSDGSSAREIEKEILEKIRKLSDSTIPAVDQQANEILDDSYRRLEQDLRTKLLSEEEIIRAEAGSKLPSITGYRPGKFPTDLDALIRTTVPSTSNYDQLRNDLEQDMQNRDQSNAKFGLIGAGTTFDPAAFGIQTDFTQPIQSIFFEQLLGPVQGNETPIIDNQFVIPTVVVLNEEENPELRTSTDSDEGFVKVYNRDSAKQPTKTITPDRTDDTIEPINMENYDMIQLGQSQSPSPQLPMGPKEAEQLDQLIAELDMATTAQVPHHPPRSSPPTADQLIAELDMATHEKDMQAHVPHHPPRSSPPTADQLRNLVEATAELNDFDEQYKFDLPPLPVTVSSQEEASKPEISHDFRLPPIVQHQFPITETEAEDNRRMAEADIYLADAIEYNQMAHSQHSSNNGFVIEEEMLESDPKQQYLVDEALSDSKTRSPAVAEGLPSEMETSQLIHSGDAFDNLEFGVNEFDDTMTYAPEIQSVEIPPDQMSENSENLQDYFDAVAAETAIAPPAEPQQRPVQRRSQDSTGAIAAPPGFGAPPAISSARKSPSLSSMRSGMSYTDSEGYPRVRKQSSLLSVLGVTSMQEMLLTLTSLDALSAAMRKAGLETTNLIFGIDYTASNKYQGEHCFGGKSLHTLDPVIPNPYQQVILIFGETLAPFASSGTIPAYGFGDETTGDWSVFRLKKDVDCADINDLLRVYNAVTPTVKLSGPTNFAPLIYQALEICERIQDYHILVIIADGQVTNERATRKAIVRACQYPLSIIVVGVGDGPWDMMRVFDESLPKRPWDNFHFVEFDKVVATAKGAADDGRLSFAIQSLLEIPDQYHTVIQLGLTRRSPRPPHRVKRSDPTVA